ncbi:MAG TPA: hypothetical protein VHH73_15700, partial [Verrucomicrobiae bacterium]|nr:hypothetical protein [Verrucomicrobiae bacterium]
MRKPVLVLMAMSLLGCSKHVSKLGNQKLSSLEVTNFVTEDGREQTIIAATNGVSFVMSPGEATTYIGLDQSLTLSFNTNSEQVTGFVLEITSPQGEKQWIADLNGDGIPDRRRIGGKAGFDVFYEGKW